VGHEVGGLSDAQTASALITDEETPNLNDRESALADWADIVSQDPNATSVEDIKTLDSIGLSDQEIVDATMLVALRVAFTTVNTALGTQPDQQLTQSTPPEIKTAVTFGRPPSQNPSV
jgi:alkylhydroperoxidase family enzyme